MKKNIYKNYSGRNIKFIYLNDDFYKNEPVNLLDIFSDLPKSNYLNLESFKELDDKFNIILIAQVGLVKKDVLNQIQKYLEINEDLIIGWINLDNDISFN